MSAPREGGGIMSDRDRPKEEMPLPDSDRRKPSNTAPDAVKDPNEKTDGKPSVQPQGDEVDPGSG